MTEEKGYKRFEPSDPEEKEQGYQCPFNEKGWHDPFYGFNGWLCRDCQAKLILGIWYHSLEEPPEPEW